MLIEHGMAPERRSSVPSSWFWRFPIRIWALQFQTFLFLTHRPKYVIALLSPESIKLAHKERGIHVFSFKPALWIDMKLHIVCMCCHIIFIFAPCINSIKNTFYCSNWCTLL